MRDDLARDLESLGFFRHPVPRRRIPLFTREQDTPRWQSRSVALTLLILIVGGSFLMADRPPSITFLAWPRGEKPLDHLPFLNAMSMVVDLDRDGYPGFFALGPDGRLRWLFPGAATPDDPRADPSEIGARVPAGPKYYFPDHGFQPRLPGSWLFVHFIARQPLTGLVQAEIVTAIQNHLRDRFPPYDLAHELKRVLVPVFGQVIVQPFLVTRSP